MVLETVIELRVQDDGTIADVEITERSGFDEVEHQLVERLSGARVPPHVEPGRYELRLRGDIRTLQLVRT